MKHRPVISTIASQKQKRGSEVAGKVGTQEVGHWSSRQLGLFNLAAWASRIRTEQREAMVLSLHLGRIADHHDGLRERHDKYDRQGSQCLDPGLPQFAPVQYYK